jgi:hypothetical protein
VTEKVFSRHPLLSILFLAIFISPAAAADVPRPLPIDDQKTIAKQLGPEVVGAPVSSKPIDPAELFRFHNNRVTYLFTSGKSEGKRQTEELSKIPRPGGKFVWRLQLAPSLVAFLRQMPDGDVVMPAVADTSQDALVVTTPPNPFLCKGMKLGETRSYSQQVSVRFFDDLSDERYSGTLKTDYTYIGTFQVKVPAGTFDAILLRSTVDGKVGPARTHAISYNFFSAGRGLVAMILQQNVTAFWIYNVNGAGGKVLVSR